MPPSVEPPVVSSNPRLARALPLLRERLYGGLACLSTLMVLLRHDGDVDSVAWSALLDVAVAAVSLWAASLLSDYVAHLAVHGIGPRGADAAHAVRASGQILTAALVPALLLVAAGLALLPVGLALRLGVGASVLALGLSALLAVRRTALPWWKKVVLVAVLLVLGAVVVAVKILAHG